MKIARVHIKNLNSLRGEWTIDFEHPPLSQTGIFAITGPTGAGKTTVLDAITLALYGALARSKEVKEVLSYGTVECQAEVEFQTGADRYLASWRIYRARGKSDGNLIGPKRELARWNSQAETFDIIAEKIREVDEAVEAVTGLDYHRFTRSVLLSQGDFAAFLKADERERSDLLERITGTEIYSEISKAAFARAKVEQQKLDQLQEQLKNLGLLSEEPVDPEELAALRAQTQAANASVEQLRRQVQGADRYQEALGQLVQLKEAETLLQQRREGFAEQQAQLMAIQALRPHYPALDEWARLGSARQEQEAEVYNLQAAIADLTKGLVAQTEVRATALAHLDAIRKQTENRRAQLQEAALVQQSRDREAGQQAEQQEALDRARAECESWQVAIESTQDKLSRQQAINQELTDWLQTHQADAALEQRLPAIEEQRERLVEIYRERERQLAEKTRLTEAASDLQAQVADLSRQLSEQQQAAAGQLEALRQVLPARFDLSRDEAVERLREEVRRLELRARELSQLQELDAQYRELLREEEEYQGRLANLLTAQEELSKAILSKVEAQDAYRPTLAFRRKVYQQQQLIANYTKDRQALQAGEPCPLCGSTEHPYHEELEPLEDQALAELETAQSYYEQLQREERQLLQQENELAQEIRMLRGQDLEQISGRLAQQQARMEAYEAKIAGLIKPNEDWSLEVRGGLLDERLQQISNQLQQWQQAEAQVAQLNKQLKAQLTVEQELDKQLSANQARLEARAAELARVEQQLVETEQRYKQAIQRVDEQLKPLDHAFELATAKQVFADLRGRAQRYRERQEQQASVSQQIQLLSSKAEQLGPQWTKRQEELQAQETQLETTREKVAQLSHKLDELLGGQRLDELRAAVEAALSKAEAEQQEAQEAWHELKSQVTATEQRSKDRQATLAKLAQDQTTLEKQLLPTLSQLGYATLAEAQARRLSPAEEEALEAESQAIRLAQAAHETAKQAALAQRDKWVAFAEVELTELQQTLGEQESTHQQLLRQLGQLEEKQAQAEKRKLQHASILEAIDTQRQAFNRWAQLNELIGQADGKKFRTFAQGLTLQKLVALANTHLERLNGRYLIHKRPEADLELDIIDTFQADNRRSMYTLSGGESFLVSLALALGLSDLAGKQAHIHSLFIDEGFGTLDEHSLDLALDTLENLQSSGKTIGVISHVKALKERIGVQIQIEKGSNGFSKLQVM